METTVVGLRMSTDLHQSIKIYCAKNKIKIKDFIETHLSNALKKKKS